MLSLSSCFIIIIIIVYVLLFVFLFQAHFGPTVPRIGPGKARPVIPPACTAQNRLQLPWPSPHLPRGPAPRPAPVVRASLARTTRPSAGLLSCSRDDRPAPLCWFSSPLPRGPLAPGLRQLLLPRGPLAPGLLAPSFPLRATSVPAAAFCCLFLLQQVSRQVISLTVPSPTCLA